MLLQDVKLKASFSVLAAMSKDRDQKMEEDDSQNPGKYKWKALIPSVESIMYNAESHC